MGSIALLLQQNLPGVRFRPHIVRMPDISQVYVYSLEIGSTIEEDERNGFLMVRSE